MSEFGSQGNILLYVPTTTNAIHKQHPILQLRVSRLSIHHERGCLWIVRRHPDPRGHTIGNFNRIEDNLPESGNE